MEEAGAASQRQWAADKLPQCLWQGQAWGHLVPQSAETWLGLWLLPVCSELAGSCGSRRWRELGSYTGHFTHFSSSQNYRPAFLFSGLGKADLSSRGLGKEGKGLLWEG